MISYRDFRETGPRDEILSPKLRYILSIFLENRLSYPYEINACVGGIWSLVLCWKWTEIEGEKKKEINMKEVPKIQNEGT